MEPYQFCYIHIVLNKHEVTYFNKTPLLFPKPKIDEFLFFTNEYLDQNRIPYVMNNKTLLRIMLNVVCSPNGTSI